MSTFEILVFESHDLYDTDIAEPENAVNKFVDMCYKYVNPCDVEEKYTQLSNTNKTITYQDRNAGDKPKLVMLIGPVTGKLYDDIQTKIKNLYSSHCGFCGVEIPMTRAVCKECANK